MTRFLDISQLTSTLRQYRARKVAISFHTMGDSDGVGAAVALSRYFINSTVVVPDFVTRNARLILEKSGYKGRMKTTLPKDCELLIITDTNTTGQLGKLKRQLDGFGGGLLFIDHHLLPKKPDVDVNATYFNSEDYNSASSIVYEVLKKLDFNMQKGTAMLLINGIVADSAELKNATALTFHQISELLRISGTSYSKILDQYRNNTPPEIKYNSIRDVAAAEIELINGHVFMYGSTETHANACAEAALNLGADASLFWRADSHEISLSARLRPPLDEELSIHLGKVMQQVAEIIQGNGGGHPCAAGAYGPRVERKGKAIEEATRLIKEKL